MSQMRNQGGDSVTTEGSRGRHCVTTEGTGENPVTESRIQRKQCDTFEASSEGGNISFQKFSEHDADERSKTAIHLKDKTMWQS